MTQRKHGHTNPVTPTYRTWQAMWTRCTNPRQKDWRWYGGRGIKISRRWLEFANFLEDMGEKPDWATGGIDRIDPDGHYTPENCRWSTSAQQHANRRAV